MLKTDHVIICGSILFMVALGLFIFVEPTVQDVRSTDTVGDKVSANRPVIVKRSASPVSRYGAEDEVIKKLLDTRKSEDAVSRPEPNGQERDIDYPREDIKHDEEELSNTGEPCKPGSISKCRGKRKVSDEVDVGQMGLSLEDNRENTEKFRRDTDSDESDNNDDLVDDEEDDLLDALSRYRRYLGVDESEEYSDYDANYNRHLSSTREAASEKSDSRIRRMSDDDSLSAEDGLTSVHEFYRRKRSLYSYSKKDSEHHPDKEARDADDISPKKDYSWLEFLVPLVRKRRETEMFSKTKNFKDDAQRNDKFIHRSARDVSDVAMEEDDDNPNSGYEPWMSWTPCSVTCGTGQSERRRKCRDPAHCHSGDVEIRICSPQDCHFTLTYS